jgi:hypothetical protein
MNRFVARVRPSEKTVSTVKRWWLTMAFFLGFGVDYLTLNNVEQVFDNVILAMQVTLAMSRRSCRNDSMLRCGSLRR